MIKKLVTILIVVWGLSGCSPMVRAEQTTASGTYSLSAGSPLGQTFITRYDGLEALRIYLQPDASGEGAITLYLRTDPNTNLDIRTATLRIDEISGPGYYTFRFDPVPNSAFQYFYARLEIQGAGRVQVGTAGGSTYLNGSLYQDTAPLDGQLAFKLTYDRNAALLGLFKELFSWLGYGSIALFLFVIPGWSLLSTLLPGWRQLHWAEKTAIACGVSLSVYPILILWTDLFGLHLGSLYAWLPALLGISAILWRNRIGLRKLQLIRDLWHSITASLASNSWHFELSLILLLGLVAASRIWIIRPLAGPIGSDSYHHSLIVQLLDDHAGLFRDWGPYAELTTFTYHFGFHAAVAAFRWLIPLPAYKAVLIVGQIFNILAVLAVYPLTMRIVRSRWAGLVAIWIAGLASSMPMVYLNWGRYTQLTGQIIMPAMIILAWATLETQENNRRSIILTWIAIAGLALTHYRVLLMSVFFFPAIILIQFRGIAFWMAIRKTLWLGLGSAVLVIPWFIRGLSGNILDFLINFLSTPPDSASGLSKQLETVSALSTYLPYWLWLMMAVALAWGLWKRNLPVAVVGSWWFLALIATNPGWVGLPGAGAISNKIILLALYIPAGMLTGGLVEWLLEKLQSISTRQGYRIGFRLIGMLVLLISGGLLARSRLADLTPNEITLTQADLRAASWIQSNLPEDARFLVNSHFYFFNWPLGSDAGHWLPLIARRSTTLPPMIYSAEQGPTPDFAKAIPELPLEILSKGVTNPEVLDRLRDEGVTHVYIGQAAGPLGSDDPYKLPLQQLIDDSRYRPIYHEDRVWVFEIVE